MSFYDKAKWVLGILMIFVLIIATNLIDRNNFLRVKDSVSSIYEDRLVAKGFIYEIATLIHDKELAIAKADTLFISTKSKQTNTDIQNLIDLFEGTKLTSMEGRVFNDMKVNFELLVEAETAYVQTNRIQKTALEKHIFNIKENLNALSEIQLSEGRRQQAISNKAIDKVELFTNIEIYILIFLAIIIQIIVIYNPKVKKEIEN